MSAVSSPATLGSSGDVFTVGTFCSIDSRYFSELVVGSAYNVKSWQLAESALMAVGSVGHGRCLQSTVSVV